MVVLVGHSTRTSGKRKSSESEKFEGPAKTFAREKN